MCANHISSKINLFIKKQPILGASGLSDLLTVSKPTFVPMKFSVKLCHMKLMKFKVSIWNGIIVNFSHSYY